MVTRPPIEKIRRLALAAAMVVTLVLAGSYGVRRWRAYQARRTVPTAIPQDVQQQAEKFTFSRSEEGVTLFTVQASRTIERTGSTTLLENVVAVLHGHRGERADEIRAGRCEYDVSGTGEINCPGEVMVTLGGAAATAGGAPQSLRLTTAGVHFDPAQGVAWTAQPVRFAFSGGTGEAVGLHYQPQEPAVRLESQVAIHLTQGGGAPVEVRGSQLQYYSRTQVLELFPPLSLQLETRNLEADRVRLEMDSNFRAQRIEATGNVRGRAQQGGRELTMRAHRAVARYAPDGSIEQLRAVEGVEFVRRGPDAQETLTCQEAVFHFAPSHREVERVVATGDADLVAHTAEETRELRAPAMELILGSPDASRQLLTATQRGTLVLHRPSGEQRTLVADRIQIEFQDQKRLRGLAGSGNVQTKQTRPDGSGPATSSDELRSRFDAEGNLAQAEQWGHFRYTGERWRAEAARADYQAASETYFLREQAVVWDATSRTTARSFELSDKAGTVRAEGDVRTTQRRATPSGGSGTAEPVQLASDRMRADRNRNWARYEGQARMWDSQNRLSAAAIELFQKPDKLVAEGNVIGLFLEAPATEEKPEKSEKPENQSPAPSRAVTVTSDHFTYFESERRGVFEGNVKARDDFGFLTAPRLEVFLTAGEGQGSQRLERAHGSGGVVIEQPDGQASGEEAEYRADAQTVVVWGGTPTLRNAERGSVTGAQLTLFLTDGRILVNSGEGTRTVTRRPWSH